MIPVIIVGITMGLIIIASLLYRGKQNRVWLLRIACIGLFIATFCRGLEPVYDGVWLDLFKRWAILVAQAGVVLLVLSFSSSRHAKLAARIVCGITVIVAVGEAAIAGSLPVHEDGTVFHQAEVHETALRGQAWALVSYHALYLSAFAAATTVVAVGCWITLRQKGQPFAARLPVLFILAGAIGSGLFIGSSLMDLLGHPVFGGSDNRKYLLIAVVTFFFFGLMLGIVRRFSLNMRRTAAIRLAHEIVFPLWRTSTALQPDVRLPPEVRAAFDDEMQLSRLTIETHDALRLIREDDDPALEPVRRRHPSDPELSAGLLRHLGGENSVPPLSWLTVALTRIKSLRLEDDPALGSSLTSLYQIRVAMGSMRREESWR